MQYISTDLKDLGLEFFMREALTEAESAGQAGNFPSARCWCWTGRSSRAGGHGMGNPGVN
jgi:hypothetical protein